MAGRFWVETLGCPKNQVDSDKLTGTLVADGMARAASPDEADLIVVNTCAFVEAAREESIGVVLDLGARRAAGARLVVTGCMAERYGDELAAALPEVDQVAGFGVPLTLGATRGPRRGVASTPRRRGGVASTRRRRGAGAPTLAEEAGLGPLRGVASMDLLELPRPPATAPWAYVKVAEGCDRACGFCAIPSFRGKQRSRRPDSVLAEVEQLGAREVVLVAQDTASYGSDLADVGRGALVPLVRDVSRLVDRVRVLYLYPSDLGDALIDAICDTGVPYFDLSLQHVSRPLVRRMRRWGDGATFLARIADIRRREPAAAFRSNFIVGYPGETEADHDALLAFVEAAQLDWCGFFSWSREEGTYAAGLDGVVAPALVSERLSELSSLQDRITTERRAALVGEIVEVLVDAPGVGRSHREAPEIDGIVEVPASLAVGSFAKVRVTGAAGPDVQAELA